MRWPTMQAAILSLACALLGCESTGTGLGVTASNDFTLSLQVEDRFIHVGDEAPITVRLRRTDGSNLRMGQLGAMVVTTSVHGRVDQTSVGIEIGDNTTAEVYRTLVFTAETSGIAEVRVSFLDATALVEILISRVNP
jgi:hypothetical protein